MMRNFFMKIVGWLADFFPNTYFYSSRFLDDFNFDIEEGEDSDAHKTHARTCMLGIAVAAHRNGLKPGGKWTVDHTGVTDGGRSIGDYIVTVERKS